MTERSPRVRRTVPVLTALLVLAALGVVGGWQLRDRAASEAPDGGSGGASGTPSAHPPPSGVAGLGVAPPITPAGTSAPTPSVRRTGAPAVRGGWPGPASTGVPPGRRLVSRKTIRVTKPGTVLDGLDVRGDISVEADNVVIRNTRIVTAGHWGIVQRQNARGLVVKDCDIRGNGKDRLQFGIFNLGGMITIQRNDISIVSDAISTNNGLIIDNYLHHPKFFPDDHIDMIQSNSGPAPGAKLIIRHNTILNTYSQTAAVALFQDFGVQHDAVIENNLLGGGGYAIYGGAGNKGKSYNIQVLNNVFSRQIFRKGGYFGPVAYWDGDGSGNVWRSNVWEDTGAAVKP